MRFIQIKGILQIPIRGKVCKVDYNMMIPNKFPRTPPFVRIINRNPQYIVDPFYASLKSPTDSKSFVLNQKLMIIKRWNENNGLVNVVIESTKMMAQNFPFAKQSKNSLNESGSFGNTNGNNLWGQLYKSRNLDQWGNMNQNSGNYYNPITTPNNNQPQIQYNYKPINLNQTIASAQKFVGESKKIMQKLKTMQKKALQQTQYLQSIKSSLDSQQSYLRKQNIRMAQFFKKNQKSSIHDISSLIRTKDQCSQQILNIVSSIKAKQDCITLVQSRFSANQFSFDQFCKIVRKLQQGKFQEKALLRKFIK